MRSQSARKKKNRRPLWPLKLVNENQEQQPVSTADHVGQVKINDRWSQSLKNLKWKPVAPGVFEHYLTDKGRCKSGFCKLTHGARKNCKVNGGEDMPIFVVKGTLKLKHAPSGMEYDRNPITETVETGESTLIPGGSWFSYENIGDCDIILRFSLFQ